LTALVFRTRHDVSEPKEDVVNGIPHTIELPRIGTGIPKLLRRALGLEAKTRETETRSQPSTRCHLCGSSYPARSNHLCPNLYGR
jgi:hypothetical protein